MRLQDPAKKIHSFAVALRAIGQDLVTLLPQTFEIRLEAEAYWVHGVASRGASDGNKATRFERRYSNEDIDRIDREGRRRQRQRGEKPDAASLPESLRTIGRIIDGKSGRLLRVTKEERKITFEYVDAAGASHREDSSNLTAYQEQQRAIDDRTGKDTWDQSKD